MSYLLMRSFPFNSHFEIRFGAGKQRDRFILSNGGQLRVNKVESIKLLKIELIFLKQKLNKFTK